MALRVGPGGESRRTSAAAADRAIERKLRRMILEEKVDQRFVANVFGESARASAPDDVEANQAMYGPGIRNARDLIDA